MYPARRRSEQMALEPTSSKQLLDYHPRLFTLLCSTSGEVVSRGQVASDPCLSPLAVHRNSLLRVAESSHHWQVFSK